jgi:hypothetical protein
MTQETRTQAASNEVAHIVDLLKQKGSKYDKDIILEIGLNRALAQITIKAIRAEACKCPEDTMAELDDIIAYAALTKSLIKELTVKMKEG